MLVSITILYLRTIILTHDKKTDAHLRVHPKRSDEWGFMPPEWDIYILSFKIARFFPKNLKNGKIWFLQNLKIFFLISNLNIFFFKISRYFFFKNLQIWKSVSKISNLKISKIMVYLHIFLQNLEIFFQKSQKWKNLIFAKFEEKKKKSQISTFFSSKSRDFFSSKICKFENMFPKSQISRICSNLKISKISRFLKNLKNLKICSKIWNLKIIFNLCFQIFWIFIFEILFFVPSKNYFSHKIDENLFWAHLRFQNHDLWYSTSNDSFS